MNNFFEIKKILKNFESFFKKPKKIRSWHV